MICYYVFHSGTIPNQVGNLQRLLHLFLYSNSLSGTIPSVLGQLNYLEGLHLNVNELRGTIPTELGFLSNLINLYLYSNEITGTIPTELGTLTNLNGLYLYTNYLLGTIPTELGQLSKLIGLNLYINSLTGTIPSELGQLFDLTGLYVYNNCLTGSIPSEFGQLSSLKYLYFNHNYITGIIPYQLGSVANCSLRELFFHSNYLSSTIPHDIGLSSDLIKLIVNNNYLSGTMPVDLFQLPLLVEIDFASNYFIGSIPDEFELPFLTNLILADNYLTGTLPTSLWNSTLLHLFNISYNSISGSLPEDINNLTHMITFEVEWNLLSGSLPLGLGALSILNALGLGENYFTGDLPVFQRHLQKLGLGDNFVSGSLPESLRGSPSLHLLNLSSNMLVGGLDELFGGVDGDINSTLPALRVMDFSRNSLTGTIPSSMFINAPNLLNAVMYSNCFSGTIPEGICNAGNLSVLVLDGASSSPACDVRWPVLLNVMFKVVLSKKTLSGSIPECMWSLPGLTTFHAAGNGLQGTLGELPTPQVSQLYDVSLASNRLTGSIPLSWQTSGKFTSLDLSSNKLSGTLSPHYRQDVNGSELDLTLNRLSSSIPSTLYFATGVNLLQGNLFTCNSKSKPHYDPNRNDYVCGSDNFDTALILTVSIIALSLLAAIWCYIYYYDFISQQLQSYNTFTSVILSHKYQFDNVAFAVQQEHRTAVYFSLVSVFFVCFVLILYVSIKSADTSSLLYSTHTSQYTWVTSAVYMHGIVPAMLVCLFLWACASSAWNFFHFRCSYYSEEISEVNHVPKSYWKWLLTATCLLLHCTVMVAVNVSYVFALFLGTSGSNLIFLQLLLSVFKLVWNFVFIRWTVRMLTLRRSIANLCTLFMTLFTFLASPLLATIFTDVDCFRLVVVGEPVVTSSFNVFQYTCELLCTNSALCANYCQFSSIESRTVYTTVTPPWLYSYQCSSAVLVNYIPVLLMVQTISGIGMPFLRWLFAQIPVAVMDTWVSRYYSNRMFRGLFMLHPETIIYARVPLENVFDAHILIARTYLNLAMLMTFGIACPLLSILTAIDSWSNSFIMRLLIVRYISLLDTHGDKDKTSQAYKQLHLNCTEWLYRTTPLLVLVCVFACLFWSGFVFDMVGDVYGPLTGGLMMLIPLLGCTICCIVVNIFNNNINRRDEHSPMDSESSSSREISMHILNLEPIDFTRTNIINSEL